MDLTKRKPKFGAPLTVLCGHCSNDNQPVQVESWLYYEGGRDDPPMIFTASCHGETINLGIQDVAGFEETMTKFATEGEPFIVFAGAVNGGG